MKLNEIFASRYLKADELADDMTVTIRDVQIEQLGKGNEADKKPVLYFEETEKGLACNKTNCNTIAKLHGDDTDDWIGKRITLFATEVDFQGEQVLAIRVRMRAPAGKPAAPSKPQGGEAPAPASKNPRTVAWLAFCDVTPNFEQERRTQAWADALAEQYPGVDEKKLTKDQWQAFAEQVREAYSEEIGGFIPV